MGRNPRYIYQARDRWENPPVYQKLHSSLLAETNKSESNSAQADCGSSGGRRDRVLPETAPLPSGPIDVMRGFSRMTG